MKQSYEKLTTIREQDIVLKDEKMLKERFAWWYFFQIRNLFLQDKRKGGIMGQYLEIDKIFLGEKTKMISKLYKYLLKILRIKV